MYKQGDHIAFMTKQPQVHLNEMFGYNNLTEDDFEESEYKGIILDVFFDKVYLVKTVCPLDGFICIVGEEDILRQVGINELNEDRKAEREGYNN